MTGLTHLAGGVASLLPLTLAYPALFPDAPLTPEALGAAALAACLGALLPDLDAPQSLLKNWKVGYRRTGKRGRTLTPAYRPFEPVASLLSPLLGHRRPLHSLLGLGVAAVLLGLPAAFWLGWPATLALVLGYASHLLLDACTVSGVPLLWPDPRPLWALPKRLRAVTGGPWEDLFLAVLALLGLLALLPNLSPTT